MLVDRRTEDERVLAPQMACNTAGRREEETGKKDSRRREADERGR